jgi:hypothetical protein
VKPLRTKSRRTWRATLGRARFVSGFFALLTVLMMVSGLARAGSRYFYCEAMAYSAPTPCCEAHHEAVDPGQASLEQTGCCDAKTFGALPSAHLAPLGQVSPPALAAVLSTWQPGIASYRAVTAPRWLRYGSDPPSPSEARPMLMVFLR